MRAAKGNDAVGQEGHANDHTNALRGDRWMGRQQQDSGEAKPGDRRNVPGESERADGELGAAKELGQIIAAEETDENVAFAEI